MKSNSPSKSLILSASIILGILTMSTFTSCRTYRNPASSNNPEVIKALANAISIAPELDVEKIKREKEFGKFFWSVKGNVRGQKVEVEFENRNAPYPSPKNPGWK